MKLCLPTTGNAGLTEKVYNHFGSAEYFTIYDTNSKQIEVVENDNLHHAHGACQPVGIITKYKIDVVLTSGMGARAVNLLNSNGTRVFLLKGETVQQAIDNFEAGQLPELTVDNACTQHGCH